MKVGILGAGGIARKMALTLNGMEGADAYAVASRNLQKAQRFAEDEHVEKPMALMRRCWLMRT